jgi:hypothetical protein
MKLSCDPDKPRYSGNVESNVHLGHSYKRPAAFKLSKELLDMLATINVTSEVKSHDK